MFYKKDSEEKKIKRKLIVTERVFAFLLLTCFMLTKSV
ncbi:hypothetical protein FH5_00151 [Priestia endophytica]|nr:hypothetical protein FH5_00151 [Priestia endophytica]